MKLTKSQIILFVNILVCIALFNPQAISQVQWLDTFSTVVRLIIFTILLLRWIYEHKVMRYQIAVFLLFLIKSIYISSMLLIIANAITILAFPGGLYTSNYGHTPLWILGQKQDWLVAYISFFMASIILWNEKKIRTISYIVYASMLYTFTQQFPLGLILYFVVVLGLLLISKKRKILTAKTLFLINAILEIITIIIAFNFDKIIWLNNLLAGISAGEVLTKQDTMLQRIYMWKDGLGAFIGKPILGIGYVSSDRWRTLFHLSSYHPNFHNTPIDIMVTSGLIGLVAYIFVYVYSEKKLDMSKSRHSVVITYGIFGINILMLTEGVYAPFVWFFIFLGIYIDRLDALIESSVNITVQRSRQSGVV